MGTQAERNNFSNVFNIDTQGICFLCLRLQQNGVVDPGAMETTTTHSFQKLSRFLDLDYQKIFNISASLHNQGLEESELLVTLCQSCSLEANYFFQVYQELEQVMMKANECVRSMHRIMHLADCNPSLVQQYRERMVATNPMSLIQASITENFRTELKAKCLMNPRRPNINNLPYPRHKPLPQLMSLQPPKIGPGINPALRRNAFQKRPYRNQPAPHPAKRNHIDLDNNINTSRSNSPPPLVISSVSGAGGASFISPDPSCSSSNYESASTTQPSSIDKNTFKEADTFLESLFSLPPQPPSRLDKPNKESSESWFNIGDGRVQCRTCGKFLQKSNTEILLNHERMHNGKMPIQCNYCPERFRNNWTLRSHFIANHRAELLGRFRKESVSLEDFKKVVELVIREDCKREVDANGCEGTRYLCTYCGKSLGRRSEVESHLVQYHSDNVGYKLNMIQNDPASLSLAIQNNAPAPPIPPFTPVSASNSTTNSTDLFQNVTRMLTQPPPPPPPSYPISETKSECNSVSSSSYTTTSAASSSSSSQPSSSSQGQNSNSNTHSKCNLCGKFVYGTRLMMKHQLEEHGNTSGSAVLPIPSELSVTPIKIKSIKPATPATLPRVKPPNIQAKSRLSQTQTQQNVARPTKRYSCSYCKTTFGFFSTHRIHQLNVHRLEMFSSFLAKGTTLEDINEVMIPILGDWRSMPNGNCGCKFCDRLFTQNEVELSQLRNHILLTHFEELVVKLQHGIAERKAKKSGANDNPTLTRSEIIVPKQEAEDDDDVIEILPD